MNVYLELTKRFNLGKVRAVIAGGQAVVMHRLSIMSKDGDWILREDAETMNHILVTLEEFGAHYRFGAPLDVRWLAGGWSAHLEFMHKGIRVRTDFVTRPPRLEAAELESLWNDQKGKETPFVNARHLAELKKTNREKDYAVIGEVARLMTDLDGQILYSRSARDLLRIASEHPKQLKNLLQRRPALGAVWKGTEALEAALDMERRQLMHANEQRMARYMAMAEPWAEKWPETQRQIESRSLKEAHEIIVRNALNVLPFK